ncbi:16S rRNA (guanine1207-N2)-methyltransferase [Kineococcus xinjiangensis]|uniref:16S rRNA (Guanine1207-N2)-methyltransferase n=1 Tax=Kineococcus xinjiangensis TaxID=512762 RepID=A0A2S6IKL9_9ACTN|nr:methyltransferase [Kineococcus xinjiangensis]PPK94716.1 16S rRNA (guanine1207-N2)-methyltransferase [Kineococcus xinjiangensis]
MPAPDESELVVAGRPLRLQRYPHEPRELLRAFDAADEYLLDHVLSSGEPARELAELSGLPAGVDLAEAARAGSLVLLDDRWGALATALAEHSPVSVTDSAVARAAARANLARHAPEAVVPLLGAGERWPGRVDVLLVRLPKTLSLLEEQLHRLRPALHPGSVVVAAGMVKEVHTSTLMLFEELLGPVRTSRARRKARLLVCAPSAEVLGAPRPCPWPRSLLLDDAPEPLAGVRVVQHGGVFSAGGLDVGTRLLLEVLGARRRFRAGEHVLDLGCGNGVLGLAAARAQPGVEVTFVDDSDLAVASAAATWRDNAPAGARARFLVGDSATASTGAETGAGTGAGAGRDAGEQGTGEQVPAGSVDVVLNNPPFHVHGSVTASTAHRMFRDARRVLRPGGELWVVGNRHLGHHVSLRRLFGAVDVVAGHPKFVVLRAVRR